MASTFFWFDSNRLLALGFLTAKMYANKPLTIKELTANIWQEILSLQPQMLSVMENSLERAHVCEAENGLRDIIFRSWVNTNLQTLRFVMKKNYLKIVI